MGKRIDNISELMKNDFKSAFSNPIVIFILIAIIILPSLYAVLNIQACWDPYGNTGNVEFAIANLDSGSSFQNETINIGNELVKDLKNNDKFKWTFVTEEELRDGVNSGKYFAGIIIPKNLTENVVSITGDNPKQAKLEYIVNIKSNPVGTKLTDSGANTVYTTLNAKIIEVIDLAAYGKLGELQEGLASGAGQLSSGGTQLQSGTSQISSGADQLSSASDKLQDGASQVKTGADKVKSSSNDVKSGASKIQQASSAVQEGSSQVQQGSEELDSAVDSSLIPEGPVKSYVESSVQLARGSGQVAEGSSQVAGGASDLAGGSVKLAEGSSQVAGGASDLADGSTQMAEGSLALAAGAELLGSSAAQALFTAASSLGSTADQLAEITGINETVLGDYFFSPVQLDRHEVFPVPDYGSVVAPFYIALSMWVGALITCVMMEPKSSEGTKYTPLEMYSGKLLLYLIMSILEACVTLIGLHILGVYITNEPLFMFSAVLVSISFMILVYSLISTLQTVGKGIVVILLVLQISATGGIYPVQIMHPFFQSLHPYMPMTYAISLLRESQLGVVWANYWTALGILVAIGIVTVILAILVKEKADKPAKYFEDKLEDSGLF